MSVNVGVLAAGVLMVVGFVLFAVGVNLPERGGISRRVWSAPVEEAGKNLAYWRAANWVFAASGVVTGLGLALLSVTLWERGSAVLGPTVGVLALIASVCWIFFSVYRVKIVAWAASGYEEQGVAPSAFEPLAAWASGLGSVYMMLSYLAAVALGGAVLETGLVTAWIGWMGVVVGGLLAIVMAVGWPGPYDQDGTIAHVPAWAQIIPILVGIALIIEGI